MAAGLGGGEPPPYFPEPVPRAAVGGDWPGCWAETPPLPAHSYSYPTACHPVSHPILGLSIMLLLPSGSPYSEQLEWHTKSVMLPFHGRKNVEGTRPQTLNSV